MTGSPLVSVFLPTYRRGDSGLLSRAIESVLVQEFLDFELLISDDGSTDSTAQVLAAFAAQDERIECVRHDRNSGLPALRIAQLLPRARGRYFAYMFDDDFWYPNALAVLVASLERHPDWEMTYGNTVWPSLKPDGTVTRDHILGREPKEFDAARLRISNYISNVAVMHRRDVIARAGVCDPHILLRRLCDWDLWLRIASVGTIGHTDVVIGEATGRTTTDSLGHTASVHQELTKSYMSLDRDALLLPENVLSYPVDGLEIFGENPPAIIIKRAAQEFAGFYREVGDQERAGMWERRAAQERTDEPRIAAVVVLYQPSAAVLDNIDSYRGQVDAVIAIDNTEAPDQQLAEDLRSRGVAYTSVGGNKGIAAALNAGCRQARSLGFDWALTLDQDSTATPGMVARLFGCVELGDLAPPNEDKENGDSERSRDRLLPLAGRIAVVAPVWQQVDGLPVSTARGYADLGVASTSGSLIRLPVLEELGGFREDLFDDGVDHEFCLRARRQGWRVVQQQDAVLLHRMGRLRKVRFPVPCWVSDYNPVRRYYMVRNLLEVGREYEREFPAWVDQERGRWRKDLVKVAFAEPHRFQKAKMMVLGWLDYRRGRFGRYEDLHPR
jgi:GT2 family glycosyltransferase